jgi:hypothetical protein
MSVKRLVVGISGARGVIYAIRLLEVLKDVLGLETHPVFSSATKQTIVQETNYTVQEVEKLATAVYRFHDIAAAICPLAFNYVLFPTDERRSFGSEDNIIKPHGGAGTSIGACQRSASHLILGFS